MMEGTAPAFSPQIIGYLNTWAKQAAQVMSTVAGAALGFDISLQAPAEAAAAGEGDLWLTVKLSGALKGNMSLRLNRAHATAMAQRFTGEPPHADFKAEYADSVEELFRQIGGHVATALQPVFGDVQLQVDKAEAPAWPAAITAWMHSSTPSFTFAVEACLSAELVEALAGVKTETAAPEIALPQPACSSQSVPDAAGGAVPQADRVAEPRPENLDLVMNVELAVSLRFGTRQLLLKDVLDLTAGSVVELDQHVKDPVDLLLDGRLVARGEVVVIDGNYGLRVTEVAASTTARV